MNLHADTEQVTASEVHEQDLSMTTTDKVQFVLLLVHSLDIFYNFLPSPVYFLTLVYFIWKASRVELAFLLIFFPSQMFMYVFDHIIIGNSALLLFLFTGILLLYSEIRELKADVARAITPMIVILAAFLISYTYAPKGYYSGYKIIAVLVNGLAYFAFFAVFIRTRNFDNIRFSLFLLFLFLFFVKFEYEKGVMFPPEGVMDFGFIRRNVGENFDLGIRFVGYHEFGALALYATIMVLAWARKLQWFQLVLVLTGIYFGFLSGARQMILGLVLVFIVFLVRNIKYNLYILIGSGFIIVALSTVTLGNIHIPFLSDYLLNVEVYQDALGRSDLYARAIDLFVDQPLTGTGIGGFVPGGEERNYPHNIVLEIMAEGGLFMLGVIGISLILAMKRSHFKAWDLTANGSVYVFLVFGFLVRSFSSSDLIENIAVISALSATGIFSYTNETEEEAVHLYQ